MTTKVKVEVAKSTKEAIDDWKSKLQSGHAKAAAAADPGFPERQKEKHKELLQEPLGFLRDILETIKPLVYGLRSSIEQITEETQICAIYLLFGSVISKWEAMLSLLKQGRSYEAMDQRRSLQEALDLIELFISDTSKKHLEDWFDGKIVLNWPARNIFDRILKHTPFAKKYSAYSAKTYIYSMMSGYTHNSYAAVSSELVDVFTEDLDRNQITGYYRSLSNSTTLKTVMESTVIQLKALFVHLDERDKYQEADKILKSIRLMDLTEAQIGMALKKFSKE